MDLIVSQTFRQTIIMQTTRRFKSYNTTKLQFLTLFLHPNLLNHNRIDSIIKTIKLLGILKNTEIYYNSEIHEVMLQSSLPMGAY